MTLINVKGTLSNILRTLFVLLGEYRSGTVSELFPFIWNTVQHRDHSAKLNTCMRVMKDYIKLFDRNSVHFPNKNVLFKKI